MRVHAHVYEIPAGELSLNSDARKLTDDPPLQRGSSKGHREPSRGWSLLGAGRIWIGEAVTGGKTHRAGRTLRNCVF